MRKKIDKRGRKLIDYDKERHAIQQMQNSANRNEAKFARYFNKQKFTFEWGMTSFAFADKRKRWNLPSGRTRS